MKIISLFIAIAALSSSAFSQYSSDWKISDYLKNLPKQYKTYESDISEPTVESTLIDDKNGYAAYLTAPKGDPEKVYFEMALFKPQKGAPTIVVSNYNYDFVCFKYDTFFLQKQGNNWIEVRSKVLPALSDEIFFVDSESYEYYKSLKNKLGDRVGGLVMHFYPPRRGTVIGVKLELCDHVDDSVEESEANNFLTVTDALKTILLSWNREKGKFEIVSQQE